MFTEGHTQKTDEEPSGVDAEISHRRSIHSQTLKLFKVLISKWRRRRRCPNNSLPSGQNLGPSRPGTKYPVMGNPHFDMHPLHTYKHTYIYILYNIFLNTAPAARCSGNQFTSNLQKGFERFPGWKSLQYPAICCFCQVDVFSTAKPIVNRFQLGCIQMHPFFQIEGPNLRACCGLGALIWLCFDHRWQQMELWVSKNSFLSMFNRFGVPHWTPFGATCFVFFDSKCPQSRVGCSHAFHFLKGTCVELDAPTSKTYNNHWCDP